MGKKKKSEWEWQWSKYYDKSLWLFTEWIYPFKLEDFRGKDVLDCGCGGGQHLNFVAPYCKHVLGVDLNTSKIAKRNNKDKKNVEVIQGDISKIKLDKKFDIVYSIGVIHHTDDPNKTFNNIKTHAKRRGKVIIWVYSYEGNFLNRTLLEGLKTLFFSKISRESLWMISNTITTLLYIPVYTIYLLPLDFLPFFQYFGNFRKLSFERNNLNVFDKLNAPVTHFIKKSTINRWFNKKEFSDVHISNYKGVSWRASGTKK